jgi:transportin-3
MELQIPPHSNDLDEELQRVCLALRTVFSPHLRNAAENAWWSHRQLADRYLTSFQGTTASWMICDRLLQEKGDTYNDSNAQMEQQQRQFFAAQTLHTKCRVAIDELPSDALPMLRESLLQHLQRFAVVMRNQSDEALITRLAMCISALAVQMEWTTIVTDLLSKESQAQFSRMVSMVILRALPEECASDRLMLVDDASRFKMRDHLVSSAPLLFTFLQENMEHQGQAARVLKTFHIWVRYVPIRPDSLLTSALLPWTVQAMTQAEYLEAAADVLVEILRMYPSHHYGNEALVQRLIPSLSQLPLDAALQSESEDVMRAYCRVVTEMGESYMSLILLSHNRPPQPLRTNEASQLVEAVLKCSNIPDSDIAGITLHFWYRFVSEMESLEPYEWRQTVIDTYAPYLLQLIQACASCLMRYPEDYDEMAEDIVADLQRHRHYVEETIEDCCRLMGEHSPLKQINSILHDEIRKASGQQDSEWHGLESCLASIAAMHRFVPRDEGTVLPFCFTLIPQLPTQIRPLRCTGCNMIGRYAPWLAVHPEYLQPLLPYLAESLSIAECAPAAAVAIKELCGRSNETFSLGEPVLQLYEELSSSSTGLNLVDEINILEGACQAVSRVILDTRDDGRKFLTRLAIPIGTRLTAIVNNPNATPKRIIPEIERLTAIIRYLTVPYMPPTTHPAIELLQSLWTLLDTAVNRFPSDFALCEAICRLHKHTIRTVGAKAYSPMLDSLLNQLIVSFGSTRQASFLYAASICITEYGRDREYSDKLFSAVSNLSATVFSFNQSLEDLTNHPDVAEEFFYLISRMISFCPDPIVHSPLLESVTKCAAVGMQMDHYGANKGTLKFLETIIIYGLELRKQRNEEGLAALERALSKEGRAIVLNLTKAMIGELPSYGNQSDEILWKLSLLYPNLLKQWLMDAFANIPTAPDRAKLEFMSAFDSGLARDEFSTVLTAFEKACSRERRIQRMHRRP